MQIIAKKILVVIGCHWFSVLLLLLGLFFTSDHRYEADDSLHKVTPSSPKLVRAHRLVLVIIDALRDGFLFEPKYKVKWPKLQKHLNSSLAACSISHVEAPTSTIPRIKALTTGKVVGFSALLDNLNVGTERQDTWLDELVFRNWRFEFYGDDTWITMFPGKFTRMKGLPTFYLYETEHVDNLIEKELPGILKRKEDWQGLILHHSGIDHIGHVKGVGDPMLMSRLMDMDIAMDRILQSLRNSSKNDDWLFILTGDHGMNSEGSHGGSERDEVSTGAVIISSASVNSGNKTCTQSWKYLPETQQIDMATLIGIITGAGIPSGSVGVVDPVWLETFWPDDPSAQLLVLSTVMQQFAKLSGCQSDNLLKPACTSLMFSPEDAAMFNSFTKEINSALVYYDQKASKSFEPKHKILVDNIQQFLRRIQRKAVVDLQRGNLVFLILGVIGVWLVTAFLWMSCIKSTYVYWTTLRQTETLPLEKMPAVEQCRRSVKQLTTPIAWKILLFIFLCLLAQSISLLSTTYTYNEKHVWNHYSVSLLLLFCFGLMDLGEFDSQPGTKEKAPLLTSTHNNDKVVTNGKTSVRAGLSALVCLLALLWFDRLILNRVQASIDLFDRWTNLNSQNTFQIVSLVLVIVLRIVAVYGCPWNTMYSGKILLIRLSPIFVGVMMALIQWEYRTNRAAGNIEAMIINARIMFVVLIFDALAAFLWRRNYSSLHAPTERVDNNGHGSLAPKVMETSLWTACIHPLSTFALLVGFLVRPSQNITWILVMIKEVLFSWSIRRLMERHETSSDHGSSNAGCKEAANQNHGQTSPKAVWQLIVWLIYWIQGWTTFFQQGSTHSLGTVDVAAAYVGLSDHYIVFCAPLLIVATFGGPIFWQLAFSARSLFPAGSTDQLSASKWLATCKLAVSQLPITFVVTACLCMRNTSAIWAVYTPKLIYLLFFQLSLLPFQLAWTIR